MWDIVWVSPQGHRSVSVSRHFLLQALQCPCSVRIHFAIMSSNKSTCLILCRWLLFLVAVNYVLLMPTNCLLLECLHLLLGYDHPRLLGRDLGTPFLPGSPETLIWPSSYSVSCSRLLCFLLIVTSAIVTVPVKCCMLKFLLWLSCPQTNVHKWTCLSECVIASLHLTCYATCLFRSHSYIILCGTTFPTFILLLQKMEN